MNDDKKYSDFCALWQRRRTMVWNMCLHHAPMGSMECEDMVQEVAVALWKDYNNLLTGRGAVWEKSWVWWHTRTVLSHMRRRKREELLDEGYDIADTETWKRNENIETLEEMMSILNHDERRVMQMRIEGYEYEHIASAIGTTPAAAKQAMYRAKRTMQEHINKNQ